MSLGQKFPSGFLRAQITRQLVPGIVFKMNARMDDGKFKEKRFVLLKVDSDAITCVINSQLTAFTQKTPSILKCQVVMPQTDHQFMSHDSHVDCSGARRYPVQDVVNELIAHPEWILGPASDELKAQMVAALKCAPMISPAEVAVLCEALTSSSEQK